MCFAGYPAGAVLLTNADRAVLLLASDAALRLAGRSVLARSAALWGAVDQTVDHVEVQDAAGPNGVPVQLSPVGPQVRVLIAPVSAGPAKITAFSQDGTAIQVASQG
jgi:hypothetical protein